MPRLDGHGPNGLWSRRPVAERAVRSHGVVMPSPLFDQHRCLPQRVEDLAIQQLVPEFAVEAFIVSVLPRAPLNIANDCAWRFKIKKNAPSFRKGAGQASKISILIFISDV